MWARTAAAERGDACERRAVGLLTDGDAWIVPTLQTKWTVDYKVKELRSFACFSLFYSYV